MIWQYCYTFFLIISTNICHHYYLKKKVYFVSLYLEKFTINNINKNLKHFKMNNPNIKFVIWWNSPCKGMINVLKYFCQIYSNNSIIITGETGSYRQSMGWNNLQKCFNQHILVPDTHWKEDTLKLYYKYHDYIHVFNGITRPYFSHLIDLSCKEKVPFMIMTEAYSNLEFGLKRQIKKLYLNWYLPLKVRPISKKSLGVFCLSGKSISNIKQFKHLGFKENTIIPFGYWTEPPKYQYEPIDDKIHIICPGVLKPYKGVDVLIKAISELNKQGITNYICHITGNGIQQEYLISLVKQLKVQNIIFHGALSENDYAQLLSHIDILVAPGYFEPWGIRINEAIQRGQIVICSDGLGANYLINESKGGDVFKSGDFIELSKLLYKYLSMSKETLDKIKFNNLEYSENISCTNKAGELYNQMLYLIGYENL